MKKIRPSKPDDQEKTQFAFNLIVDLFEKYPDIEGNIWSAACWSALAQGYINCDFSFEEFKKELISFLAHSRKWFDK